MTTKNDFIWYELLTTDADATIKFYGDVVGWKIEDSGMPGGRYDICKTGPRGIAGIMQMPQHLQDIHVPPHWGGFIHVGDVDATAEAIKAAGGAIYRGPENIPHVGRFAVAADPQGGTFTVFRPEPMEGDMPPASAPGAIGTVSWHELVTTDWPAAWSFYEQLFGWTKSESMDMGPMGTYEIFSTNDLPQTGAMMNAPEEMRPYMRGPFWTFYFVVDDINAAKGRVEAAGGNVTMGPHQVPGDSWILQGTDPQGARFALVAPTQR